MASNFKDSKIIIVTLARDNIEQVSLTLDSINLFCPEAFSLIIDSSINHLHVLSLCSEKRPSSLLKVIYNKPEGIYSAMNSSLSFISGYDYVMWLNSGDVLLQSISCILDSIPNGSLLIARAVKFSPNYDTMRGMRAPMFPPAFIFHSPLLRALYFLGFSYNHQAALFPVSVVKNMRFISASKIYGDFVFKQKVLSLAARQNIIHYYNAPVAGFFLGGQSSLNSRADVIRHISDLISLLMRRQLNIIPFLIRLPSLVCKYFFLPSES